MNLARLTGFSAVALVGLMAPSLTSGMTPPGGPNQTLTPFAHHARPGGAPLLQRNGNTWFRGIVHAHTKFSDGNELLEEVVKSARETGLAQFLFVTDHYEKMDDAKFAALNAAAASPNSEFVLVPSAEITTFWNQVIVPFGFGWFATPWLFRSHSHLLALGFAEKPETTPDTAKQWAEYLKTKGKLVVAAHPHGKLPAPALNFHTAYLNVLDFNFDKSAQDAIQGVEIFNDCSNEDTDFNWYLDLLRQRHSQKRSGVFVTSGCDFHNDLQRPRGVWERRTFVHASALTATDLLEGIRDGRTIAALDATQIQLLPVPSLTRRQEVSTVNISLTIGYEWYITTTHTVQVYRDGQLVHSATIKPSTVLPARSFTYNWTDDRADPGDHWYVVRVPGVMVSSPINVHVKDIMPTAAMAVVMDRSGSMEGDKLAGAKRAADALFDMLSPSNSASLVTFATVAQTEVPLLAASQEVKDRLKRGVQALDAGDSTNITAGLASALSELTKDTAQQCATKGAFLLSDGMHNTGAGPLDGNPSIVAEFSRLRIPIHTIGYGIGSDMYSGIDTVTLGEIARRTGGRFWWGTPWNLAQVYHKINAHLNNRSVLVSYNDLISMGKELTYDVQIDKDITAVTFFADWQGSTVDLHLELPRTQASKGKKGSKGGKDDTAVVRITPSNFRDFEGVTYAKGDTYSAYTIANPAQGKWKATLYGKDIPQPKEQVNLTVSGDSPLVANILGFQPEYKQQDRVKITISVSTLLEGLAVPVKNAKVSVKVKMPEPNLAEMLRRGVINLNEYLRYLLHKEVSVGVFDGDGKYDDGPAGDGIFCALYRYAYTNGVYLVTATVTAKKPDGQSVTRELKESFQVGPIQDRTVTLADFIRIGK